jgi:hypothetical protein
VFDPAKLGSMTGASTARQGVWSEVNPQPGSIADQFAEMAAQKTGGNQMVVPLVHRADRPGVIELNGDEKEHEIAATLSDA